MRAREETYRDAMRYVRESLDRELEGQELRVQGGQAARIAVQRAADVAEGVGADAGNRFHGHGQPLIRRYAQASRERVEVAVEVFIRAGQAPEVQDEQRGAEHAAEPAVFPKPL